jgi:chromosome segregation ATPase
MSSGEREMLLVERESLLVETGILKSDRDRVTKDRDRLLERVAALENEKARLGAELDELSDQCAQLRTEKIRAEGMGKGSDIRAMSLNEDVKRMSQEATEMKLKLADMERRLGDSERRARGEEARANDGEAKLASMERLVEESSEACNLQRHRCNILRALVETFRSEPASVMADSAVSDTGRGLRGAVDLSEEVADGEPAMPGGEAPPFSLWRTVAEQRAEIVDLNADLEEANQRVAILQVIILFSSCLSVEGLGICLGPRIFFIPIKRHPFCMQSFF